MSEKSERELALLEAERAVREMARPDATFERELHGRVTLFAVGENGAAALQEAADYLAELARGAAAETGGAP